MAWYSGPCYLWGPGAESRAPHWSPIPPQPCRCLGVQASRWELCLSFLYSTNLKKNSRGKKDIFHKLFDSPETLDRHVFNFRLSQLMLLMGSHKGGKPMVYTHTHTHESPREWPPKLLVPGQPLRPTVTPHIQRWNKRGPMS